MRFNCRPAILTLISVPFLMTAGCSSMDESGYGTPSRPIAAPVVPAYVMEDLIGGYEARARRVRAAGISPLPAAEIATYLARQELELRRQTAGTGVEVIRSGDVILVRLPAYLTFSVGRADLSPQAASIVSEVSLTLRNYNRSLVDVLGHTDSTGNPTANQALSQRRADAVATRLKVRVAAARIATRGYAASYPIGDNVTEPGKALNRRVEIKVVPLR